MEAANRYKLVYKSVNFRYRQGVPLFNALIWGKPLNSGLQNLASFYHMVQSVAIIRCLLPRFGGAIW